MITPIESVLHKINNPGKVRPLNILTSATHEGYQTLLGYLPHKFYMLQGPGFKTWDYVTKPVPDNHYIINQPFPEFFPKDVEFDLILSQDRFGGLQRFLEIGKRLNIPVLHIDHALVPTNWNVETCKQIKSIRANKHLFVAQTSKDNWEGKLEDQVIYYGLDNQLFNGWTGGKLHGISVVNHFPQRDVFCGWNIWKQVSQTISMKLVGENPGLSESAKSTEHLVSMLAESRFFLNTSQHSTFPMTVAEALMVGVPVISTSKRELPLFIEHGINGFLADSPEDMIKYANLLLQDYDLAKKISAAARERALDQFSQAKFLKAWDTAIRECYEGGR